MTKLPTHAAQLDLVAFGQRGSVRGISHYEVQWQGEHIATVWKGQRWGKWKYQLSGGEHPCSGWYASRKDVVKAALTAWLASKL
jgi:hypothetical protein